MSKKHDGPTVKEILQVLQEMVDAWHSGWFDTDTTADDFGKGIEVVRKAMDILERQRVKR